MRGPLLRYIQKANTPFYACLPSTLSCPLAENNNRSVEFPIHPIPIPRNAYSSISTATEGQAELVAHTPQSLLYKNNFVFDIGGPHQELAWAGPIPSSSNTPPGPVATASSPTLSSPAGVVLQFSSKTVLGLAPFRICGYHIEGSQTRNVTSEIPIKNGIAPYVVNCGVATTNAPQKRSALQTSNGNNGGTRQRLNRGSSRLNNENMTTNRTMDSLNYWKRAFNTMDPAAGPVIPERVIKLAGGPNNNRYSIGSKTGIAFMPAVKGESENRRIMSNIRRPTPPPGPRAMPNRHLPAAAKKLLKTLSPIQNSPQFLSSDLISEEPHISSKHMHRFPIEPSDRPNYGIASKVQLQGKPHQHHYNTRRSVKELMHEPDLAFNVARNDFKVKSDTENEEPIGGNDTDDDLVFAIEI
ncbi:hypothetical protein Ddc_01250 [Ditylenchus destructor]|nr:hypothetical protein Ddc_01250 [Ditylenchus destructor]